MAVSPKAYGLEDTFLPANWRYLNSKDLDLGSGSPVIFPFEKRTLLATGAKEGVIYLLNANNLGGGPPDHTKALYQSPRWGNDQQIYSGLGIWGGLSTYQTPQGDRLIYVPMWGPPAAEAVKFKYTNGAAPNGSIMAFQVASEGEGVTLKPLWTSRDLLVPDSVALANGVVYAVQTGEQTNQHPDNLEGHGAPVNGVAGLTPAELAKWRSTPAARMTLYALDAETGKELYSSKNAMSSYAHFSQPVVALGKVFVISHDSHVYAFGLK
jgi:outer membrane protein assembly factor BamB